MGRMKTVKELMREVPYALPKDELQWMGTYMMAEAYSDFPRIMKLTDGNKTSSRDMARRLRRQRLSHDRDILLHPEAMQEYRTQQVVDYSTQEERMAGAIDLLREWEKAKHFKPYGDAQKLSPGDQVVVAVEGHSLQGRRGVVAGERAGQYLIEVETRNGAAKAYLNARDLTVISKNRF